MPKNKRRWCDTDRGGGTAIVEVLLEGSRGWDEVQYRRKLKRGEPNRGNRVSCVATVVLARLRLVGDTGEVKRGTP